MNLQSWDWMPTWADIRKIGENRTVRTAGVWAVLVPVAAKLMQGVADIVQIQILSHQFSIHLSLPFSWKVLFFVALAFMLANILYSFFCPSIIKETQDYRDYAEQKRSGRELNDFLDKILSDGLAKREELLNWLNWFSRRGSYYVQQHPTPDASFSPENEARTFAEIYAFVINTIAKTRPIVRGTISLLYAGGFLGVLFLVYQNAAFVIEHW